MLMEEILEALKRIEKRLDKLEQQSEKMSNHINFVQKTYNLVRVPLNYIKNKFDRTYSELPTIENNNVEEQ
jgi:prefoldin subunit 5